MGVGVSFSAVLFLGSSEKAAFASQTPAQVNSAIFGAALKSGSFHYVDINNSYTAGTDLKLTQIGDIGRHEGIQYTTGTLGKSEIIVLNSVAYMKGDVLALKYQLGYSQREATTYANRWISFTPSDSAYADVTDLVTLGSFWSDPNTNAFISVPESPRSETSQSRFNGQRVQSITYSIHDIVKSTNSSFVGSSELYAAAKAPHLPLASISRTMGTLDGIKDLQKDSGTFTKWGERVAVIAPTGALPVSSSAPAPSS